MKTSARTILYCFSRVFILFCCFFISPPSSSASSTQAPFLLPFTPFRSLTSWESPRLSHLNVLNRVGSKTEAETEPRCGVSAIYKMATPALGLSSRRTSRRSIPSSSPSSPPFFYYYYSSSSFPSSYPPFSYSSCPLSLSLPLLLLPILLSILLHFPPPPSPLTYIFPPAPFTTPPFMSFSSSSFFPHFNSSSPSTSCPSKPSLPPTLTPPPSYSSLPAIFLPVGSGLVIDTSRIVFMCWENCNVICEAA